MQVNQQNYREVLVRHLEGELSADERRTVESYISSHGEAAEEWRRLQRTRLQPDMRMTFPNKARLYRAEEEPAAVAPVRKLTPYPYLKYLSAVAAAIVFAAIYFVLKPHSATQGTEGVARIQNQAPMQPKTEAPLENQQNNVIASAGGTISPIPDKGSKKDEKQKKTAPKKTIIIVQQPEEMKEYAVRSVAIPVKNEPINIPSSALALEPKTRVDFIPEQAEENDEYVSTFSRVYRFFTRNISLRKEQREDESIYAFRLQTKTVSIYKTFRGL
jgi:hypothetical protein